MWYNTAMNKTIFKAAIAIILVSALAGPMFALADTATSTSTSSNSDQIQVLNQEISTRKDKIKELEQTIEAYKSKIDDKQTQGVSLKNQLSILDAQVSQTQTDIDLTKTQIDAKGLEIEALNLSIQDKENTIAKQQNIIAQIIQNLYVQDQKNFLEIMLTYSNFADFYDELKYFESLDVDLGRSIKLVRTSKEELDAKKAQVVAQQQAYQELQQELLAKQDKLNGQVQYKQTLLTETKSSELQYRTLLASLKQQYQVVETEVQTFEERVRKQLEQQDKIETSGSVVMSWPVPSHTINATFHDPSYPFRNVFEHSGIDIRASQGTPVHAAASGYIARARRCTTASCYAYVIIIHTGNISSVYGHLSAITVADDAYVNRGDVIGYSGATPGTVGAGPFVTGPHLHFEVRLNGIPVDPMPYMAQ